MAEINYLTETEINAFLKAARLTKNGIRDYCLALLAYRHALRVSELIDLRLHQVELETAHMHIRRLKNGLSTIHPIEGDELRAIRAWLRVRSTHKLAASEFFFLSNRGPFTRQAFNYLCKVIGKKAGLGKKVYPHMLRHSCGFTLANKNTSTRTIQDYLGHKNIMHTVRYTAANPERFKNLWRK
jgi:type 1 fimbriae regulatory protein FimB